jgi:hypothetical protein
LELIETNISRLLLFCKPFYPFRPSCHFKQDRQNPENKQLVDFAGWGNLRLLRAAKN